MKYPNLIAAAQFTPALSTMADHANSTKKRIEKLLAGTTSPYPFEAIGLSQLYGCTTGFLFCPKLQVMRVDKFQHQQKIVDQLEKINRAMSKIKKKNIFFVEAASILEQGLTSDITYAAYLWATDWVRLACCFEQDEAWREMVDNMEDPCS